MKLPLLLLPVVCATITSCTNNEMPSAIDRYDVVTRNNVILHEIDTFGSLSVGNGEFAFTVDVSGLQSFPDKYENGIPLGTQSQWAWHRTNDYYQHSVNDIAKAFPSCDSSKAPYAIQHSEGKLKEITDILRGNPHRLHLGLVGLKIKLNNGEEAAIDDLKAIRQELDLWAGRIITQYEVDGEPVKVTLYADQESDAISAKIESPLIAQERIKVELNFPYGKNCHVCPGYDFTQPTRHSSSIREATDSTATIERILDSTRYYTFVSSTGAALQTTAPHQFELTPGAAASFEFSVGFSREDSASVSGFKEIESYNIEHWKNFWTTGGVIDFSECTDGRAPELERRVVLSQYLTKIQCAGSMPPQETGLTMNSWFGKFHLEMHWWHAVHFELWNRPALMDQTLDWYNSILDQAKSTAQWQGYPGARWPKMTDPAGRESPSNVGAFIIWQQPHPIYLAEQLYRQTPDRSVLEKYSDVVMSTAEFMASFVKKNNDGKYHLCHPLIPAQEIFKATETDDPTYELQYWHFGLTLAQQWRNRLGMPADQHWQDVIDNLAPLPVSNGMYLPNATTPAAYTDDQFRRDHPSVLAALGCLPANSRIDAQIMNATLKEIMRSWQWETTWGWDYPMIAMTAARVNEPEIAIDALMMDVQKNTYLVNGHNFQDNRLRLYLPGNGGLLAAVAMMCAGWEGNHKDAPGFPKNGKWNVKWEGLKPML
jgi:hypothetical protein